MNKIKELKLQAIQTRRDILNQGPRCGCRVHVAPGLSCADIVTALYFDILNIRPDQPDWQERDRFVISKGHACPALYSVLARRVISRRRSCGGPKTCTACSRATPICEKPPALI